MVTDQALEKMEVERTGVWVEEMKASSGVELAGPLPGVAWVEPWVVVELEILELRLV